MVRSGVAYVALMLGSLALSAQANLLQNPSFEQGASTPEDWSAWGDGDFLWQSAGARTGAKCMNLGGDDFALMYQRAAGSAGIGYTFSVWARHATGEGVGEIKLEFHDAAQAKILEHKRFIHPGSDWTEFLLAGVAPEGTVYVTGTVVGLAGSTVLFDDAALAAQIDEPELVIDVHASSHSFLGFGTQIWDTSNDTRRVCDELNIRYTRLSTENTAAYAAGAGMNVMFIRWMAPVEWMDENNALLPQFVDDYAALWADTVAGLAANGLTPPYIELSNEPDGNWNTYISPENYNALVKLTRVELDTRGLTDVGIVGPSLSNLDWQGGNAAWIAALDEQAVDSLAAWGSHMWDDGSLCSGGATCVENNWEAFGGSAIARDAALPRFVSEFATKENTFHGVTYPHPDSYRDYNATNTMAYAARVYENALALLNSGAHVPFIWQAVDVSWETKGWGLIDLAGSPKPVFYAMRTLCPAIPPGASVVELGDQSGGLVYGGAFVDDDRLVIGLANDSLGTQDKVLWVTGVAGVQIVNATACLIDHHGDPATEDPDTVRLMIRPVSVGVDNRMVATLPSDSTLTIVCDLQFPVGDLDHSGTVNLGDLAILADCLGGPGGDDRSSACSDEHQQRADFDDDGDVDLRDFAVFAVAFGE